MISVESVKIIHCFRCHWAWETEDYFLTDSTRVVYATLKQAMQDQITWSKVERRMHIYPVLN